MGRTPPTIAPPPAGSPAARGRVRPSTLVGLGVALTLAGLVAWSAQEGLVPAQAVRVAPVLWPQADQAAPARPTPTDQPSLPTQPTQPTPPALPAQGQAFQAPGWVEADPFVVAASALTDGVVAEVLVLEGQAVQEGQPVARLVADDARLALEAAQAELERAQARLAQALAERRAAEAHWAQPIERQRAVDTTAAQLDRARAELAQLPALVQAQATAVQALQAELERAQRAQADGAANALEVLVLGHRLAGQRATLRATEQRREILAAQVRTLEAELAAARRHAELRIEERRALEAAQAAVDLATAELALARARLRQAELRLSRLTITAPIAGVVQRRLKRPGDKVMLGMDEPTSAHVVHLYDPARLQVRADVPLADAGRLFVGQACEVLVEVLPQRTFRGVVQRIAGQADLQKNTLQAKVRIVDPHEALRPEMLARVRFLPAQGPANPSASQPIADARTHAATVRVPVAAIADGAAWVVRDRRGLVGRAYRTPVEVLDEQGPWAHVRAALHPGDLLVLHAQGLAPGQRVRIEGELDPDARSPSARPQASTGLGQAPATPGA